MIFSEKTLTILKNFSTINSSILIKDTNILKTVSPTKSILAIAELDEPFEGNACIFDLSRFLSIYGLYSNPEVIFHNNYFNVIEGNRKTKYIFADESMIIKPSNKNIELPSVDVKVNVLWDDLQSVIKASGLLQLPQIAFVGEHGKIYLRAINSENPSSDTFGIEIGETEDTFELILKTENLKLLPQNYTVEISAEGISKFLGDKITYFIAVDTNSTYKKGN